VANAYTRIAAGADDASVRQRLSGIALAGQPRMVLRPHLEILHDQVQAVHGATWGALPADALFYAGQRGLDEATARPDHRRHGTRRARALPG
jgi:Fe-S cluster assembly protein SufD